MKKIWNLHKFYLVCIFFISILVMFFLSMGEVKNGHDIHFHVSNIDALSKYINPFAFRFTAPSISNYTDSFGYGLYIFYPSLPHLVYAYFCKFFHLFSIDTLHGIYIVNTIFKIINSFILYLYRVRLNSL